MDPSNVTILYHNNCYDGICSAWVCYQRFGESATYVPMDYSAPLPDVSGRDVIFVDFSLRTREEMEKLRERTSSILILDHHKTTEAALKDLPYAVFDMNRSGAGIAWDYFFGKDSPTQHPRFKQRPDLVNYVEDRDLWRFKLPFSKEFNAYIQSYPKKLYTWLENLTKFSADVHTRQAGEALLRQQDALVGDICDNQILKVLPRPHNGESLPDSLQIPVPSVYTSVLMSEVCDELLRRNPEHSFVFYYFRRTDGRYRFGLRSRGTFDVSEIATLYGGGGHRNAAGFEMDFDDTRDAQG